MIEDFNDMADMLERNTKAVLEVNVGPLFGLVLQLTLTLA
jgi:hypothetical protein